jgi:hypothetical protein
VPVSGSSICAASRIERLPTAVTTVFTRYGSTRKSSGWR